MAAQVTNYKCPACGGPLHFDGDIGKLKCDYCDSTFDVASIEAMHADDESEAMAEYALAEEEKKTRAASEWDTSEMTSDWGEGSEKLKVYSCPSCGAELICDETTAATSCPYCGNPAVVPGQLGGALKPDFVIPFKLSKEDAIAALKEHYKGKKLLPKSFTESNHINEIKGVYVPFWLFDGEVDADLVFHATRSHVHRHGDEEIIITDHYRVRRAGTIAFEKIPVDASTKMPDNHMDSIEPFNYDEIKDFSTAYLPGFFADKYDVSAEESAERAEKRAVNTAISALRNTVQGYANVVITDRDADVERGSIKYALMPVWMLSTKWKDENFIFAVNGQTGRTVGDLPVSMGRLASWFARIAVPTAVVLALIVFAPLVM